MPSRKAFEVRERSGLGPAPPPARIAQVEEQSSAEAKIFSHARGLEGPRPSVLGSSDLLRTSHVVTYYVTRRIGRDRSKERSDRGAKPSTPFRLTHTVRRSFTERGLN